MNVETVPIDSIHVDPANVRRHGPRNIKDIRQSLEQHEQVEPLVVQRSSRRIIGGNGRLAAMVELGWTECDVVFLDIDDLAARQLALRLNRTAEQAEWSDELWAEIASLAGEGIDIESLGWQEDELPADDEKPVKLKTLSTQAPPEMSWVLIGIPTVRFREIAQPVRAIASIPGVLCETSVSDKHEENGQSRSAG